MSTTLDFSAGVATGAGGKTCSGGQLVDAVTAGTPCVTNVNPDKTCTLSFANRGDIAHRVVPGQDITLAISGGELNQYHRMLVMVQQPPDGGRTVTLPSNVKWLGSAPFIDSRSGAVTFFKLWTLDGGATIFGKVVE